MWIIESWKKNSSTPPPKQPKRIKFHLRQWPDAPGYIGVRKNEDGKSVPVAEIYWTWEPMAYLDQFRDRYVVTQVGRNRWKALLKGTSHLKG